MRFGIPSISFGHISLISGSCAHAHTSISTSISVTLLVGFRSAILLFTIIHKFSMGFISGELPGHGSTGIFFCFIKAVTDLAVWQGAPSYWKMPPPSGKCFGKSGVNFCSDTLMYWCWFILPWTMWRRPTPFTDIMDHTMIDSGCLTVLTRHCGEYCSFGCRRTYWLLSSRISNTDSSLNQTYKITSH